MAGPALHLLTLPREVRDNIYTYLWHEASAELAWKEFGDGEHAQLSVYLDNAPISNVLLTCSRIHDEYIEADCFLKLSVSVGLHCCNAPGLRYPDDTDVARYILNPAIAAYIRNVTVYAESGYTNAFRNPWPLVKELMNGLILKSPNITTMTVAIQAWPNYLINTLVQDNAEKDINNIKYSLSLIKSRNLLWPPPASLLGHSLRRRGQGYRYTYFMLASDTLDDGSEKYENIYKVTHVGAYRFTNDRREDDQQLPVADFNEHWSRLDDELKTRYRPPPEEEARATPNGREMKMWEECCGDDGSLGVLQTRARTPAQARVIEQ